MRSSTVAGMTVVAAGPVRGAFVDVCKNSLFSDDVASTIRPDAVAAVLPLLQWVFGTTLAAVINTSTGGKIGRCLSGFDPWDRNWGR